MCTSAALYQTKSMEITAHHVEEERRHSTLKDTFHVVISIYMQELSNQQQ